MTKRSPNKKIGAFQRGWVSLSANFRWKGTSPTNLRWYQKSKKTTFSCDIKISAVCFTVSSESTRVTDRQTDRQTDARSYDLQDRASIAASRGKNRLRSARVIVKNKVSLFLKTLYMF